MSGGRRFLVLLAAVALLAATGTLAVLHAAGQARGARADGPPVRAGTVTLGAQPDGPRLVFRSMTWGPDRDELASVPLRHPDDTRTAASAPTCLRFHAAAGTGICLQAVYGLVQDGYRAVVLDAALHEVRHYDLAGIPTRARVSPSGHLVAWTVFLSGDSYAGGSFSTRTSVLDTRTWTLQENLEDDAVTLDGAPYRSPDVNVWGVTFADDERFYATVATGGRTYLAAGDVTRRTLTTVHGNVECPSLSPDGTRIAYKKRVPGLPDDAPWRLYVLDLRTMAESATAEQRDVDDQALWLDGRTLAYALPGDDGTDVWSVPADGSGAPALLVHAALAPAVVR
ncbi:PD40 domain-containing protein [Kitasatospora aureofaciens]|uniref:TolB-like translocation protein n=1 Tax=Kitasatospora aureofaciens TaxID=1894 RepID=A0A1E7N9A0_KITAU|nr:PD40 domain-containing protein [Kitasatospora aureofaciens]OEV37259.1 TolB-like translocation protein [Kitasatospora aureofaciens]GGU95798.1 TolB-like translocation protein; signal peptide [Kitasatospora aureofaciens]